MSVSGISTDASSLAYLLDTTTDPGSTDPDFAADFEAIDGGATGVITKTEFEHAFATLDWPDALKAEGADAIFAQLDPAGTGRVQQADFVSGMTALAAAATATNSQSATDASASSGGLSGISSLFAALPASSSTSSSATSQVAIDEAAAPDATAPTPSADAQTAALQQTFETAYAAIDTSNTGYITAVQLAQAFGSLTLPDNIAALGSNGVLAKLDPNFTGEISHSDFVAGLVNLAATATDQTAAPGAASSADAQTAALQQTFETAYAAIDTSNAGYITAVQLAQAFGSLTLPDNIAALGSNGVLAKLDPNFTGEITHSDFVTGLVSLASAPSAPAAASSADASTSSTSTDDQSALTQFYTGVFARIAPAGSDTINADDLDSGFDQLQLPAGLGAMTSNDLYARLDPFQTGAVSQADFVSTMVALVTAANAQDDDEAAAAAQQAENDDFDAMFMAIDTSASGSISLRQFEIDFDSLQLDPAIAGLGPDVIFSMLGAGVSGSVSAADFVDGMSALAGAVNYIRNAASSIDTDRNGLVTPEEFSQAFNALQLPAAVKALGATGVYGVIDPFYTNQVSIGQLVDGLTNLVAQSGLPVDAAATTSSASSGDLILSTFYRGSTVS